MDERCPHRTWPRLRRGTVLGALALALSVAQTASAGTTGGSATAQAAGVELAFDAPPIDLVGVTRSLAVGPNPGSQTVPGTLDLEDIATSSSLLATSTSVEVARTPSGVEANSFVTGLRLTLRGETVASATTILGSAACPSGDSAVTTEAQANDVRLGDAAPVDVVPGGPDALGSTTITDEAGRVFTVQLVATALVDSDASSGEAGGLRLDVTIGNETSASAEFATASCQRPDGVAAAPGPEQPDGGLADSGTDTAVVAALLGIVLVAVGGSALLWASGRRPPRADPC